ncbi:uncharacterized protein LOC144351894 [Saccoglossus kowalevskii]
MLGLLDCKQDRIIFEGIAKVSMDIVTETCVKNGFQPTVVEMRQLFSLHDKRKLERAANAVLPEGFRKGPLLPRHVSLLTSHWTHDFPHPRLSKTLKYCSSAAIYNPANQPVAWGVHKEMGDIGMGYCEPAYRRNGFASIIMGTLAMEITNKKEIPYFYFKLTNTVFEKGAEKLRGKKHKDLVVWMMFEK